MDALTIAPVAGANKTTLPDARARLVEIDDALAAIRAQIAAADLERQATRQPIDPRWFHRAKTALRHLQRERAELQQSLAGQPSRKETLKDLIIAVLRERHDPAGWTAVLDEAHRRLGEAR